MRVTSLLSPMTLYNDATSTILDPMRKTTKTLIFDGADGKAFYVSFSKSTSASAEPRHRHPPSYFYCGHHLSLFWNLLSRLYAAGDQNSLS